MGKELVILLAVLSSGCAREPRVRVGSKNFSEQLILGEVVAQHVERRLGHVSRKPGLGGTLLAQQALLASEIDVYPEYTGTALTAVLKHKPVREPGEAFRIVHDGYRQWGLTWLPPLGFENTFAMTVRTADARGATTLSEAAKSGPWKLGAGYEFVKREDGLPGLTKAYGLTLAGPPKTMDLGLLYQALTKGQVEMVASSSTDGLLAVLPLTVLKDDKRYFPPYECALVMRDGAAVQFPALRGALEELSGKFSGETMRRLNYELDGKHRPVREIAREFLGSIGLR